MQLNATQNMISCSIRLTPSTLAKIDRLAEDEQRTRSNMIAKILNDYIQNEAKA